MRQVWIVVLCATAALAKPEAPVRASLTAKPHGASVDVTLRAVPTRDVDALELWFVSPNLSRRFGATKTGSARDLTVRVKGTAPFLKIVGGARTTIGGSKRSRAAVLVLGTAPTAVRINPTVITLPSGENIADVRP